MGAADDVNKIVWDRFRLNFRADGRFWSVTKLVGCVRGWKVALGVCVCVCVCVRVCVWFLRCRLGEHVQLYTLEPSQIFPPFEDSAERVKTQCACVRLRMGVFAWGVCACMCWMCWDRY